MKKKPRKRAPRRHRVGRGEGAVYVRAARARLKVSQVVFARLLGVSQMTVNRWESGVSPLRPAMRLAVQAAVTMAQAQRAKAKAQGKKKK